MLFRFGLLGKAGVEMPSLKILIGFRHDIVPNCSVLLRLRCFWAFRHFENISVTNFRSLQLCGDLAPRAKSILIPLVPPVSTCLEVKALVTRRVIQASK